VLVSGSLWLPDLSKTPPALGSQLGRGYCLNIFSTAFFIGFSTVFASFIGLPVGPCSRVWVALPRQIVLFVPESAMSTTSIPFETTQVCESTPIPVDNDDPMAWDQFG